ncbi:MAG: HIT domain-containing protein, partial [Actinobacteria bacterium]|nr:HIT domain-containing protein [Actinomycetota bacterium]
MPTPDSPFFLVPSSEWLTSNRSAFAIADHFPVSPGHTLVVPRRLISTWWEASADEKADLWVLVDEVKVLLDAAHSPDGYNVGFNAGRAAGQTVDHLHLHVIPRFDGDTPDPRGGVRHVMPGRGNYLVDIGPASVNDFELFDGTKDGYLRVELLRCLINPAFDRIDLVVSFIMRSGLEIIEAHLADALDRGTQVRVLTTDYMHITDHLALARLIDLGDD